MSAVRRAGPLLAVWVLAAPGLGLVLALAGLALAHLSFVAGAPFLLMAGLPFPVRLAAAVPGFAVMWRWATAGDDARAASTPVAHRDPQSSTPVAVTRAASTPVSAVRWAWGVLREGWYVLGPAVFVLSFALLAVKG